jgi:hypothetical protein
MPEPVRQALHDLRHGRDRGRIPSGRAAIGNKATKPHSPETDLEHFSAKWIRFAVKNAAQQRTEPIRRKSKRL